MADLKLGDTGFGWVTAEVAVRRMELELRLQRGLKLWAMCHAKGCLGVIPLKDGRGKSSH